jgi:hypothetical protein
MLRREVRKGDACRIYGMMEIHKCNGDFHITARGHGYQQFGGEHLDHASPFPHKHWRWVLMDVEINFTHIIDEFSFGEYYPKIDNPLDFTSAQTDESTLFSWGGS